MPLKAYIAGRYPDLAVLAKEKELYEAEGIEVTATWLDNAEDGMSMEDIAVVDLADVDRADILVVYTYPYGTPVPGGGRHVETGYALGKGKRVYVVGPMENVFHWHPDIKVFPRTDVLLRYLNRYYGESQNERIAA